MWRPDDWDKCPCDNCSDKVDDKYGRFCDLACRKWTMWQNYEAGADALWKALWKLAEESPTKTFTIDSRVINVYTEGLS